MAKLTILSQFDQIAQPLESAITQNCDRSISLVFGAKNQNHFFKFKKNFYFSLHPSEQQDKILWHKKGPSSLSLFPAILLRQL